MTNNKARYENLEKFRPLCEGEFDIPMIFKDSISKDFELVGFNYAKSEKQPNGKGIHFFVDDYQFLRLWNRPNNYLNLLKKFDFVLTPDFSTYTDFPKAMQIYNHYRKHWLGAYWQANGIKVVPTISWSDERSLEWCFDGEPKHSIVAVSSVGTQQNKDSKKAFLLGYEKMIEKLEPETIIFYGNVPKECLGNIINIKPYQSKFREVI